MKYLFPCIFALQACGEKSLNVPGGSQNQSTTTTDTSTTQQDCAQEWTQASSGYWSDPIACVAWSSVSPELTWHEAVNPSEASAGGCDQTCDLEESINFCSELQEGDLTWRTPTISELKDLTTRNPPFENIDADLWSRDSDPIDTLAWTANVAQAGMEISLDKQGLAYVRCIAD